MALWKKEDSSVTAQAVPTQKTGLCILYLNCSGVPDADLAAHVAKYKKNVYEDQALNMFLSSNNHYFIVVPVSDQTRMEFVWF